MLCNGFPMRLGGVPPPLVGGVAFHNGALELLHQPPDQSRLEKIVAARLTGRNFHRHLPAEGVTQRLIDP